MEIVIGVAVAAICGAVGALIKLGKVMKELELTRSTLELHGIKIEKHEDRLDSQDVITATILTSLRYIEAGIDELRGKKGD